MSVAPPRLQWRGICKGFGGPAVLDNFDLDVARGQSLVLVGCSGQGKTVAMKLALGLLSPDAGTVLFDGQSLFDLRGRARRSTFARMGVLFQGSALFDSLTVWENVAFRLLNADRTPRATARARAEAALQRVRLDADVADRYPEELSGGMQKRVGLARAIVTDPAVLFFDEPTTGLDPIAARAINELVVDQVKQSGCTAISITHDLASARVIGDEIAMLHAGRIVWRGAPDDLERSADPHVEQFLSGRLSGPLARSGTG
jgi:phospholipid/cholesterol/gamma-HCH transport system ATP-binding protein